MSDSDQSEMTVKKSWKSRRFLLGVCVVSGIGIVSQYRYLNQWLRAEEVSLFVQSHAVLHPNESLTGLPGEVNATAEPEPVVFTEDDVLGQWVLDGTIRRVIDNRPDGTATIDISFDFVTALRYGTKLNLDLEWTLKDNVLTHTIVDGSPEEGKKRLISDFGSKTYFKIVSMTDEQMHLIDFDDPPEESLWQRFSENFEVSSGRESSAAQAK